MLAAMGLAAEPTDGTWLPIGDYSANVQPPVRSDVPMTLRRSLGLPAVLRSIELIAGMSAQLTMQSWRGPVLVNPQPSLVTQPDPWRTADSFTERFAVNLATDGNNFTRLHRQGTDVAAMECLNPFVTTPYKDRLRSGRVVKRFRSYDSDGKALDLSADEVVHTWGLEVPGMERGLGPIGFCRAALTGILDVRDYADRWFREEGTDGLLTTDQRLDGAAAREYKRLWYERDPADPAGPRVRVTGSGLKYEPIMLKPEDAQWIEAQNFGILDVARMFGVPADYLIAAVEGSSLTYANLEMIDAQFLRTTLFPKYLRKIENAISGVLPRGQRARFDTSELLRPDAKTRAEIDQIYGPTGIGVYDSQHIRTREGIPGDAPGPSKTPAPAPAPVNERVS
jgi:HK97 family phage portal protein